MTVRMTKQGLTDEALNETKQDKYLYVEKFKVIIHSFNLPLLPKALLFLILAWFFSNLKQKRKYTGNKVAFTLF